MLTLRRVCQVPSITPHTSHPTPLIPHPTPHIPHPTSHTPHPTPHTPHHTPHTPHHTPHTTAQGPSSSTKALLSPRHGCKVCFCHTSSSEGLRRAAASGSWLFPPLPLCTSTGEWRRNLSRNTVDLTLFIFRRLGLEIALRSCDDELLAKGTGRAGATKHVLQRNKR